MRAFHLGSALLLALSSLALIKALPTQDQHKANTTGSDSSPQSSSVSQSVDAAETVALVGIPKLTPDNSCGNAGNGNNKGYTCNPKSFQGGACCSAYGSCGNGPLYCGKGCQADFGKCDGAAEPKPAPPQPSQSGAPPASVPDQSAPAQPKPEGSNCGPTFGNKRCPNNLCCSHSGYCGTTSDYCSVPENCQKAFGRCDSDNIPAGSNTSSDARPLVGQVSYDERIAHCLKPRTIALTFDDGPSEYTKRLLDILGAYKAKATFFITGNNNGKGEIDKTKEWFNLIRRMVAEGHQVASHTFDHVRMSKAVSELREIEMLKNERAIANIIGKWPTYFRPPYSDCTTESGCVANIKALGYHIVHYDLNTEDYLHPSPEQIEQSKIIVQKAFAKAPEDGNMLVLQHDIIAQSSGNLTEFILQLVKDKGWEAVTVGTCMNDAIDNWYREPSWIAPGTTPMDACIVSRGQFCGTIPPFADKASCFESVGECVKQLRECPKAEGSDINGCAKFAHVCRLEFAFCVTCGGVDERSCESKHFAYKIQ